MRPARIPRKYHRRDLITPFLYVFAMLREFRWTLIGLVAAVLFGGTLYAITPLHQFGDQPPPILTAYLAAWLALFGEAMLGPPDVWYLAILMGTYPLLGFGLVGEGIVRIGMLILSKKLGDKEWMMVKASTYRDHVILCGVGHLGYRTLLQLLEDGAHVVAIEKQPEGRFVPDAKATGTPVLIRDMKEDQALLDAGIEHAAVIVIATNDDLANLEVALDARRMNPKIRVIMRMFDQQIADKFKDARLIDEAFSSAALAAPVVARLALDPTRENRPAK